MDIIGKKSSFALQYSLNPNRNSVWMFGNFCYWCGGQQIGVWDYETSLRDALFQLEEISKYKGDRGFAQFSPLPAGEIFGLLDAGLFVSGDLEDQLRAENEGWAKHIFIPAIDVFDRWKGFLIDGESCSRLILSEEPYLKISEFYIETGMVDKVLSQAIKELDFIYSKYIEK